MVAPPIITARDAQRQPPPPDGLKYANLVEPNGLQTDLQRYPVLLLGGYAYWALSHEDHRDGLEVLVFSPDKRLAHRLSVTGSRYISRIALVPPSPSTRGEPRIAFIGQSNMSAIFALSDLVVPPTIHRVPFLAGPTLSTLSALQYDTMPSNPVVTSVIELGHFRFWPTSYVVDQDAVALLVADRQNQIVGLLHVAGIRKVQQIYTEINPSPPQTAASGPLSPTTSTSAGLEGPLIRMVGAAGRVASLPLDRLALAYHVHHRITAEDLLSVASMVRLPLMVDEAHRLAQRIGTVTASSFLGCTTSPPPSPQSLLRRQCSVGSAAALVACALAGLALVGEEGVSAGAMFGMSAGASIGDPFEQDTNATVEDHVLTAIEKRECLVRNFAFTGGAVPFSGLGQIPQAFRLGALDDLPYAAVLARASAGAAGALAYSLITGAVGPMPRDPACAPRVGWLKYLFVLRGDGRGLRTHPAQFWPSLAPAWGVLSFYALAGGPAAAAGALYVDARSGAIVGVDARAARLFRRFEGGEDASVRAALDWIAGLGYDTRDTRTGADLWRWLGDTI